MTEGITRIPPTPGFETEKGLGIASEIEPKQCPHCEMQFSHEEIVKIHLKHDQCEGIPPAKKLRMDKMGFRERSTRHE